MLDFRHAEDHEIEQKINEVVFQQRELGAAVLETLESTQTVIRKIHKEHLYVNNVRESVGRCRESVIKSIRNISGGALMSFTLVTAHYINLIYNCTLSSVSFINFTCFPRGNWFSFNPTLV